MYTLCFPVTIQSLINSLVKENKYDYTHPDIGFEWNSWAKYTVFNKDLTARCVGLDVEHNVYINHYWNHAKPWNIKCPIYEEVLNEHFVD